MVKIVPRWEWRTFARAIELQIDLADHPQTRRLESSEIYLTASAARGNPKIRDQKIDIKTLQQVNADGLEQWKPLLKASFPLTAEQLAAVYQALGLNEPAVTQGCDLDALLRLIDEETGAWAVSVEKIRNQYDVDGCIVEASEVGFDGDVFQTVAAEDPDPAKVTDTVARLGLSERENISYVKAIQRIKAGTMT